MRISHLAAAMLLLVGCELSNENCTRHSDCSAELVCGRSGACIVAPPDAAPTGDDGGQSPNADAGKPMVDAGARDAAGAIPNTAPAPPERPWRQTPPDAAIDGGEPVSDAGTVDGGEFMPDAGPSGAIGERYR